MDGLFSLFKYICWGDFGLFTMTPRYLFCVLLPVMVFLGFLSAVLERLPHLQQAGPGFLCYLAGLGCTTAALAAASEIPDIRRRKLLVWSLVLLIPCSSQIAMIAAFASMVTLRVCIAYFLFTSLTMGCILFLLRWLCRLPQESMTGPQTPSPACSIIRTSIRPFSIFRDAFRSVTDTVPSFCLGSVIISILTYFGLMDKLAVIFAPGLQAFLHLPKEAASLFIVNLFKRDFGSASLLAIARSGAFDAIQMVVVMVMLTFSVPCFNSTILLFRQEKLPMAICLWLGSFCISLLLGHLVQCILVQCLL